MANEAGTGEARGATDQVLSAVRQFRCVGCGRQGRVQEPGGASSVRRLGGRAPQPFDRRLWLELGHLACHAADEQVEASAHFLVKGWTSALAGFGLSARPGPVFSLHGPAQDAQHGYGYWVTDPAPVLTVADIQPIVRAVLNAPIEPGQFEQARRVGLLRAQTGDEPHR